MHSRYISWSRYAFLAGIVLALVLVIPTAWFPFQLSKLAAFAVCLAAAAVLFVIGGGARDLLRTHGFWLSLAVLSLPVVYTVSGLFSVDPAVAFAGFGVESDTTLFVLIASLAFILAATLFRTLRTARTLVNVVLWSLVGAMLFQLVSVLFGTSVIPFQTFADRSVNLVGKWNDLGLLASLLMILLFVRVELSSASHAWRVGAGVGAAVLAILLALVNFPLSWAFLLAGSIIVGVLALLRRRAESHAEEPQHVPVPWYSLGGIAVAAVLLIFGAAINTGLTNILPVSALEVRPSMQTTWAVTNAAKEGSVERTLLGSGPNTFADQWLVRKPAEVNRSAFWNLDFNVGYSTLATALLSVGVLGALAWLVPLLLLAAALIRVARLNILSREERIVATGLGLGALFLLATIILYVPSQNVILLGFVLAGAAFGFLWRQGRAATEELAPTPLKGLVVLTLAAVLLVSSLSAGFFTARRFVAQAHTGAGLADLSAGNVDSAIAHAKSASSIDQAPDALRLRVDAGLQKLGTIATSKTLSPDDAKAQFAAEMQATEAAGLQAVTLTPQDYRAYFSIARVYDYLASLKVAQAYESAKGAYQAAGQRNPTSPVIPLALARLEAAAGNAQGVADNITKSLTLKPDYTDAILFVVQINVANNDLQSAIQNTIAAVQSAPGVPSIWFQLGLLYLVGGDAKDAIPPLEQALVLVPDYANAKYYLGLAYYAEKRPQDAIKKFEELQAANQGNAELDAILANMRAGKPALEGLTPTTSRESAPINE
jgi:tetratricopeptide (TPR) repeat protein